MFVTHGVFGSGVVEALANVNAERQAALAKLADQHGIKIAGFPDDFLMTFAFANNPNGIVLVSMFGREHIAHNIAAAGRPPIAGFAEAVRQVLS